jgi:hypothetical protein
VTNPVTGCFSSDTVQVTINPLPIVNLGTDQTSCAPISLSAGNTGFNYLWSPGGQTTQTITANTSGSYIVRVTNPTTGCFNSDTIQVTINTPPTVNLGPDTTRCGGTVTLNAGNAGFNYLWSPGNQTSQTITVSASGTYSVRVTNPATGCFSDDTISVQINTIPLVNIGADDTVCAGLLINPIVTGSNSVAYLWSTGAVSNTVFVSTSGTVFLTVTDTLSGCFGSDTLTLQVIPAPLVNLPADTILCGGDFLIQGSVSGAFLQLNWSSGSSNSDTLRVNAAGNYVLSALDTVTGCLSSDSINISYDLFVEDLGPDTTFCGSGFIQSSLIGNYSYLWPTGLSTLSTFVVSSSGTYTLQTISNVSGCVSIDSIFVTSQTPLFVELGDDTIICQGTSLLLNAGNIGSVYNWSNGDTTQTVLVQPGTYWVNVVNGVCQANDTIIMLSSDTVTAAFSFSIGGTFGQTVSFSSASNPAWSHFWAFGNGDTSNLVNPVVEYDSSGTYQVTLIVSDGCGSDTLTLPVSVIITGLGMQPNLINYAEVFPNPTENWATLQFGGTHWKEALLYSLSGSLLKRFIIREEDIEMQQLKMDFSDLAQGSYLLELKGMDSTRRIKVMKQ